VIRVFDLYSRSDFESEAIMSRRIQLILLLLGAVFLISVAYAQQQPPQQKEDPARKYVPLSIEDLLKAAASRTPSYQSPANDMNDRLRALALISSSAQDYLLGPGDTLAISVFGIEGLNGTEFTLDAAGNISLPFLNNEVNLLGFSAREARIKITALYEASVLKNPQVTVSIRSFHSQTINVFGAVVSPGAYSLSGATRFLDVLSRVGGITDRASTKALIRRPSKMQETSKTAGDTLTGQVALESRANQETAISSSASYSTIEVDLTQLLTMGDLSLNIPILGGDIITVPERPQQFVFVLGDVKGSGAFEIKKNEQMSLRKALALSGGFLSTAKPSKTLIIRPKGDQGQSEQIPINASAIYSGKQDDVLLRANDMILVPGSATKVFGRSVLGSVMNTIGGILLYGLIYR
jgi:protein involved in polysaccharide export with SLBB domain